MLQTVMRVGNSLAITLPKQFVDAKKIKAGQKMLVDADNDLSMIQVRTQTSKAPKVTPEFKQWLDGFNARYKTGLSELVNK